MLEDEKCLIGNPCSKCIETCGYRKTYSRDNDQDEKEKENERTIEKYEEGNQLHPH